MYNAVITNNTQWYCPCKTHSFTDSVSPRHLAKGVDTEDRDSNDNLIASISQTGGYFFTKCFLFYFRPFMTVHARVASLTMGKIIVSANI